MQTRCGRWQSAVALIGLPAGTVLAGLGLDHYRRAPLASPWFDIGWLLLVFAIRSGVRAYGGHNLARLLAQGPHPGNGLLRPGQFAGREAGQPSPGRSSSPAI